jgi:SAM-dependent methyltransferase
MTSSPRAWERAASWASAAKRAAAGALRLRRESIRCPVCGSRDLEVVLVGDRPCLYTCGRCRLIFRDPRPSDVELRSQYQEDHRVPRVEEPGTYLAFRDHCYNMIKLRLREELLGEHRRALDVGCGNGLNIEVLEARGWEVEGIDPNRRQSELLVGRGKRAAAVDLGRAVHDRWRQRRYHLVTLLHVIEHLNDPLAQVRSLGALLAADGALVIETPLCCDLANPDHLFFFSGTSLQILLERAGFVWDSHFLYVARGIGHDNLIVLAKPC